MDAKIKKDQEVTEASETSETEIIDIAELIKTPDDRTNGKKGKPETVIVLHGKLDERQHNKLKHIDAEIARHQIEIAMLQDHRNYIVQAELATLGLDSSGKIQYTLQSDGSVVESRELKGA